jgi:hypothetical protein
MDNDVFKCSLTPPGGKVNREIVVSLRVDKVGIGC